MPTGVRTPSVVGVDAAQIVAALRTRDPSGLAAAYEAYADRLFSYCTGMLRDREAAADAVHDTFVVAYERVGQLREPDKLRSWLYAIARNECLRTLRGRQRTAELDEAVLVSDETVDVDAGLRDEELRQLVWAAAGGLNPREREVLDLAVRHDLQMSEVAKAMGVPVKHVHALLSKARQQLERAVAVLVVARTGRRHCPTLDGLLEKWDGSLTVLLRKRVARHIDGCSSCSRRRRRDVNAQALFAATPLLLAPAALRDLVLATCTDSEFAAERREIAAHAGRFDRAGFPIPFGRSPYRAGLRPAPIAASLLIPALVLGGMALAGGFGATDAPPPVAPVVTDSPSPEPTAVASPTETASPSPSPPTATPDATEEPPRVPPPVPTPTVRATLTEPEPTRTTTREPTPLLTIVPLPPVIIRPPDPGRTPSETVPPVP